MRISIKPTTIILIITGLYLLYNNINFVKGDPFLLYIGLLFTFIIYSQKSYHFLLIPSFFLIGAGISQIIISNNILPEFNNILIFAITTGFSQITVFLVNQFLIRDNHLYTKYIYYWPLGIGIVLLIFSLIYYQRIDAFLWEQIETYWPVLLLLLVYINNKPPIKNNNGQSE